MVDDHIRVLNEWPMVVIGDNKDYSSVVFPPINHENLSVFSNHPIPQSQSPPSSSSSPLSTSDRDTWDDSSSSSSSSSSLSSPFDSQVRKGGLFTGWLSISLQILRSKLLSTVSSFRNPSSPQRGPIWSFGIPAAAVVVVLMLLTRWKKNMRRNLTPNETRLINIIKEKDGKIAQLLHQIAQMNEILIDRYKALAAKVAQ